MYHDFFGARLGTQRRVTAFAALTVGYAKPAFCKVCNGFPVNKAKARFVAERGDLNPTDWSSLELYCVNYSIYRKAVADLAERGFSIANSQGSESRNPSLSAKASAEKIMIHMSSLLGFDPVSRRRNPVETEEEDELDRVAAIR